MGEMLPCILLGQVQCTKGCKRIKAVDMPTPSSIYPAVDTPTPVDMPACQMPALLSIHLPHCQYTWPLLIIHFCLGIILQRLQNLIVIFLLLQASFFSLHNLCDEEGGVSVHVLLSWQRQGATHLGNAPPFSLSLLSMVWLLLWSMWPGAQCGMVDVAWQGSSSSLTLSPTQLSVDMLYSKGLLTPDSFLNP